MILSKTPRLKLKSASGYLTEFMDFRSGRWDFCQDVVREVFDLPSDLRYIKFVAHNRPGPRRVKLEFNLDSRWEWADEKGRTRVSYEIFADGEEIAFYSKAQEVVERLLRKHGKIYVECLYEN